MSGNLTQKERYQLTKTIEIQISKKFENNLRERNPQVGIVKAIPVNNPLGLIVGDTVIVHHLSFYNDIGQDKEYVMQEHLKVGDEYLFPIQPEKIFATYNDGILQPVGEYVFCKKVEREPAKNGIIIPDHLMALTNQAIVIHGNGDVFIDDMLIMPDNAMYPIELDKKEFQRIFKKDIFAIIRGGELVPYRDYFIAEDVQEEKKSFLDLSLMKERNKTSVVTQTGSGCDYVNESDSVYRGANSGIKYEDKVILNADHIHFKIS